VDELGSLLRESLTAVRAGVAPGADACHVQAERFTWQESARKMATALGVEVPEAKPVRGVTMVVLTCGNVSLTQRAVTSVIKASSADLPVTCRVVNNGVPPSERLGMSKMLRQLGVEQIQGDKSLDDPQRLGVVARNLVWREAVTEYAGCIDNDAALRPGALAFMVQYLDAHPKVAFVGAKAIGQTGKIDMAGAWLDRHGGRHIGNGEVDSPKRSITMPVPYLPTCSAVMRTQAARSVGWLWDDYRPVWCEDADLCYALRAAGWEVHWLSGAMLDHWPHTTTGKMTAACSAKMVVLRGWWDWLMADDASRFTME
jgi:hypothetical protein